MEIPLDLSRYCIETALKRCHERAVSAMLKKGADLERWEPVAELSRRCLEQFDFGNLRSRHRPLAGKTDEAVSIRLVDGAPRICIDGNPIDP